jgi:hypothetical protein
MFLSCTLGCSRAGRSSESRAKRAPCCRRPSRRAPAVWAPQRQSPFLHFALRGKRRWRRGSPVPRPTEHDLRLARRTLLPLPLSRAASAGARAFMRSRRAARNCRHDSGCRNCQADHRQRRSAHRPSSLRAAFIARPRVAAAATRSPAFVGPGIVSPTGSSPSRASSRPVSPARRRICSPRIRLNACATIKTRWRTVRACREST